MKSALKRLSWIIPIVILFLTTGCETSIDFGTEVTPRLTITSQVTTSPYVWNEGEGNRVHVYVSQSPTDSTRFYTPDSLIVLVKEQESGLTIPLIFTVNDAGEEYFIFPQNFLKSGFSYSINAHAPGFEEVVANTRIPTPSTISDFSIKTIRIEPSELNNFQKKYKYTLQFRIKHLVPNRYYHLVYINEYAGIPTKYQVVDPELSDNQPFLHHYEYGVLIDRNDLKLDQLLTFNFEDIAVDDHDLKSVFVELRSVTPEYYKYHTSLARQLIARQDKFSEPVTIFNNIEGGYGNFSGYGVFLTSTALPQ